MSRAFFSDNRILSAWQLMLVSTAPFCFAATGLYAQEGKAVDTRETAAPQQTSAVSYTVEFTGADDPQVVAILEDALNTLRTGERPYRTALGLDRKIQSHLEVLIKTLRAEGFYDAKFGYHIDHLASPAAVSIEANHGPRYKLKDYVIEYLPAKPPDGKVPTDARELGLKPGAPARAQPIIDADSRLLLELGNRGYPLAKILDRSVTVDHADRTMTVVLQVDPGALARFGHLIISGAESVDSDYIRSFIPWKVDQIFDREVLAAFRSELLDTGLFDSVDVSGADQVDDAGLLPITLTIAERKHRSVGLELHWATDTGIGGEVSWEHRNLSGEQERLSLSVTLEEIRQEFSAAFSKPRYLRSNQALLLNATGGHQDTDAYRGPLVSAFAGVQRTLSRTWTLTAGIPVEFSNLEDFSGSRDYQLLGLSLRTERDTSDDALDPSRGTRLRLQLVPLVGRHERRTDFVEGTAVGTAYYPLQKSGRLVLAGRAKIGSIAGESGGDIPANRRFYAGGGASIRGYRFQSVGPLAPDGSPLGGRSLIELNTEIRVKVTDAFGGVAFLEGGNVYDESTPDFSRSLRWAAGFGVRYFTPVGPLRLDFGFPLDRRPSDDSFQFYISVGQAF
jgi:translocation and assembly module TamA